MNDYDVDGMREFTEEEVETFRLWFEFLKLSDKTKWTADVAFDFDIDYFNDAQCSFEGWWPSHKFLFRRFKKPEIEEITSVEHYEACRDDGTCPEMPVVALFVPMWASQKQLLADFKKILKKYHGGERGRHEFDGTGDVYNLSVEPDNKLLNETLLIYKASIKPGNEGKSHWKIEEDAFKGYKKTNAEIKGLKNRQTVKVNRALARAKLILENIVEGRFPVYTKTADKKSKS